MADFPIIRSKNTDTLYNYFTSKDGYAKDYGLPPMSHNQAAEGFASIYAGRGALEPLKGAGTSGGTQSTPQPLPTVVKPPMSIDPVQNTFNSLFIR